tara:strand:- start:315 stop:875 length:561 start_codon:yes stop_codon:yes gene_type:complete
MRDFENSSAAMFSDPFYSFDIGYLITEWKNEDSVAEMSSVGNGFILKGRVHYPHINFSTFLVYASSDEITLSFKNEFPTTKFDNSEINFYGIYSAIDYFIPFGEKLNFLVSIGGGLNKLSYDFSSYGGDKKNENNFSYFLSSGLGYKAKSNINIYISYNNFGKQNQSNESSNWSTKGIFIGMELRN